MSCTTQCTLFLLFRMFSIVLITGGIVALFLISSVSNQIRVSTVGRDQNVWFMEGRPVVLESTTSSEGLQTSPSVMKRVTKVVIVASMRTGSSLTGNIIQRSPSVFYVFEPLYSLQKLLDGGILKTFAMDGSFMKLSKKRSQLQTIEDIFACEFSKLDLYTMTQHHMKLSDTTNEYFNCSIMAGDWYNLSKCLTLLEESCRASEVVSVKVVRLTMTHAKYLLATDPDVKVIHLIRDPRGRLPSYRRLGKLGARFINSSIAKKECDSVLKDIKVARSVKRRFPGQLYTLRYEDLALNPIETSKELYDFIGLPFTNEIRDYVNEITFNNITKCGSMCTTKNSTDTVFNWRNVLSPIELSNIDNNCLKLYKQVGYLPLERSEMYDLSVSPLGELPWKMKWYPNITSSDDLFY